MKYQSGRMGVAEGLALSFIITFPTLFQSTPAFLADSAGNASWIVPLLGGLVSGILLAINLFLFKRYSGDLLSIAGELLGKYGAYSVGLFYFFVLFITACTWTRQFAENTLMTALPGADFHFVVFLYGSSAVILVYLGIEAVCRATYVILPFALAGVLLAFAGLVPVMKPLFLFPWQGHGLVSILKPSLFFTGSNTPVTLLFLMAPVFQNAKTLQASLIFGFGGSTIVRSLANVAYIMTFSTAVSAEKTLPFYEMARLININKYVQRLEAVFILLWVIVGVLGIVVCLYGAVYIIARLFKLPTISPLLLPVGLIMTQVASLLPDAATVVMVGTTVFSDIYAPGMILVTFALLVTALVKGGVKTCDSA